MPEFVGSKRSGQLVNQIEGILERAEVIPRINSDGVPFNSIVVHIGGEKMLVPANIANGGKRDYPFDFEIGKPFAARSFIVECINEKTGVLYNAKHYVFPDAGSEGTDPVDLKHTLTEAEYLASNYTGKPKSTKR